MDGIIPGSFGLFSGAFLFYFYDFWYNKNKYQIVSIYNIYQLILLIWSIQLLHLSMFFFTNPRSSFTDNYIVTLCLVYCVTGIAYVLAIFSEPGPARLVSNGALASICADEFLFFGQFFFQLFWLSLQHSKTRVNF